MIGLIRGVLPQVSCIENRKTYKNGCRMKHFVSLIIGVQLFAVAVPVYSLYLVDSSQSISDAKRLLEKNTKNFFTVYAAGDIADCRRKPAEETMAAQTARIIEAGLAEDNQNFALSLGDNTYPMGKPEEFSECYDKTWGKFRTRTLPSPGNHDYGVPFALGYYNYFDELAGPDRRGYYKKNIASWLILSLNSNISGEAMQNQITWLRAELKENKQNCILAFWHHPVFSSGGHGDNDVMQGAWEALSAAKADIVLTSHEHNFERMAPLDARGNRDDKNGILSMIVGTGGAKLTPMFFPKSVTDIRNNDTHGVLKLNLYEKAFSWVFLPVAGQSFSDTGHRACH
jgi:hypothetical protein